MIRLFIPDIEGAGEAYEVIESFFSCVKVTHLPDGTMISVYGTAKDVEDVLATELPAFFCWVHSPDREGVYWLEIERYEPEDYEGYHWPYYSREYAPDNYALDAEWEAGYRDIFMPDLSTEHDSKKVWYAAYGSNMNTERFNRYLPGDFDSVRAMIAHERYFARRGMWGSGGIAFLDDQPGQESTVRLWGLTFAQFRTLVSGENGGLRARIDYEACSSSAATLLSSGLYSRIMNLGSVDGLPVLTCTAPSARDAHPYNAPSKEYTQVITQGEAQTASLDLVSIDSLVLT